jgi:lantibiotic modifying enzyme
MQRASRAIVAAFPASRQITDPATRQFLDRSTCGISEKEFHDIIKAARDTSDDIACNESEDPAPLPWILPLREMLAGLAELHFTANELPGLRALCECGARYAAQRFELKNQSERLQLISKRARSRLTHYLERRLAEITRPVYNLEFQAFRAVWAALHGQASVLHSAGVIEQKFTGEKPHRRLFQFFLQFPVLARLWSQLICDWSTQVEELLQRFATDRAMISRSWFDRSALYIVDLQIGLSDPHSGGRTVMLLRFSTGSVIYKPRPGYGEHEWRSFVRRLNKRSGRLKLKAANVLCRRGYCWMEKIDRAPCKTKTALWRFYERLGGTIAAACLLRTVDCHRENLIASGEYPVLIDAEALWHSHDSRGGTLAADLYHTGFFPTSNVKPTLRFRSGIFIKATLNDRQPPSNETSAIDCQAELVKGFVDVWQHAAGSLRQHIDLVRKSNAGKRHVRHIFWPTTNYDRIRLASIQPAAMRCGRERETMIHNLCRRSHVPSAIIRQEVHALTRLDIPYFLRARTRRIPYPAITVDEVTRAVRQAMPF